MFNMSKWAEAKRPTEKHGRPMIHRIHLSTRNSSGDSGSFATAPSIGAVFNRFEAVWLRRP